MQARARDPEDLDDLLASERMRPLVTLLERIGRSDEHVIVSGAPGLDKERVARFIHSASPRQAHPFVIYDATIEQRGYESDETRVEQAWTRATGGTLFIVELYDLSDRDQALLLRSLEARADPSSTHPLRHQPVRVIAATGRDLMQNPHPESFRSSLFHRLNVMNVHVPFGSIERAGLEEPPPSALTFKEQKTRLLEEWEPGYLRALLHHVDGNLALAARTAGIARAHLYRLLKKHGLAR